jgi:hypothetical protein
MTDKTTAGIVAEPEEVEALLHNLCGFHLAERDPVARYTVLTREQVLYDALVEAIKRERGRALAELVNKGHRLNEVAAMTGLRTRQQVQRLIQVAAAGEQTPAAQAVDEVQEASRQFEERLAAVEATLDEVLSGIPVPNEPAPRVTEVDEESYETVMAKEPYVVEKLRADTFPPVVPGAPADNGAPPVVPGAAPFDPLTADIDELATMLEPTQVMPALSAANQPTVVLPDHGWRARSDDPDAT